jgi:predicted nucleotidyltransferase
MSRFGLSDEAVRLITDFLQQYSQIEKSVIFGSRALGTFKPYSDVDIALWGSNIDDIRGRIISGLDELPLPYTYDVISFSDIVNEPLKEHILDHGQILYERDES